MKRFYSHYTFIYPGKFLKNYIVEISDEGNILCEYPFEKEIQGTEFHSGLQIFLPDGLVNKIRIADLVELEPRIATYIKNGSYLIRGFRV